MTVARGVIIEEHSEESDDDVQEMNGIEEEVVECANDVVIKNKNAVEESSDDEDESNDDNDDDSGDDDDEGGNAAWADSVAKILKATKAKGKKALVLSRAKKLTDPKKVKPTPAGFQVETIEGEVKDELVPGVKDEEDDETDEKVRRKRKREITSVRKKPDVLEKDRERVLMKVATKGVVQLFNAVKSQQKEITAKLKEAGPLEVRKDKVLRSIDKRAFLDVLMGEKSNDTEKGKSKKPKKENESSWSVLKDDFMMGAKMKDWDKELEGDDEEVEAEVESD